MSVRVARTPSGETREAAGRGRDGEVRWQLLARRRTADPFGEARWNVLAPAGPGRLILGTQRRIAPAPDGRGWGGPLDARRDPRGPAPSLARTAVGVSWQTEGPHRLVVAAGREAGGARAAQVAATRGGCRLTAGLRGERAVAALGWSGVLGRAAVRAESHAERDGVLARAAIGGGDAAVLLEWDGRGAGAARGVLRAGVRVPAGPLAGLLLEGAVRSGGSRVRPFEAVWSGAAPSGTVRARVVGRATGAGASWRCEVERKVPRAGTVAVTLDGDAGPRPDAVRWSWRAGGPAGRAGVTLELPEGRPRAGAVTADVPVGQGSRLAVRARWSTGRRPALDVGWAWRPGERPGSTR